MTTWESELNIGDIYWAVGSDKKATKMVFQDSFFDRGRLIPGGNSFRTKEDAQEFSDNLSAHPRIR
ncbi:MAG: hypothetical protein V3R41_06385 [Gammaproteobacteria bacterium]